MDFDSSSNDEQIEGYQGNALSKRWALSLPLVFRMEYMFAMLLGALSILLPAAEITTVNNLS